LVEEKPTPFCFGGAPYLGFETITFVPIQKRLIKSDLLTSEQIEWLNTYHAQCFEHLQAAMDETERSWLREACAAL